MKRLSNDDLNEIRKRAEAAVYAPWRIGKQSPNGLHNVGSTDGLLTAQATNEANAVFIANARQDIPKLLAEIEWLQRRNKLANELLEDVENELVDFYLAETDIYTEIQEFLYGRGSDD